VNITIEGPEVIGFDAARASSSVVTVRYIDQ
jgi:hypothetical protein